MLTLCVIDCQAGFLIYCVSRVVDHLGSRECSLQEQQAGKLDDRQSG